MKEIFYDSQRRLFNSEWYFKAPHGKEKYKITLPHSWNSEGWTYEEAKPEEAAGVGIYEKHISGREYSHCHLKFEGVSAFCEVYINGEKVCENIGAHKPFTVRLKGLTDGDNIITVKVTDKASLTLLPENCDSIFLQSPRYKRWPVGYGSSLKAGGIWRDVYLCSYGNVHMNPFIISSNGRGIDVMTDLSGDEAGYKIKYTLSDEMGSTEKILDAACKKFSIYPENPVLSWPLHPHVYELKAELIDSCGDIVHTLVQPAYIMNFTVRNSEFRLNNKPYFLRGQNGFPHCNVPHDKAYIEKYVSAVKENGVEISRFHTEPPSHAWLDECDRQGIMVILEMPLHGSYGCYSLGSEQFEQNVLTEILAIVKEYRRHPSIVMWSMGNELIVSCERDMGLGKPLFDILEKWIYEVRKLDSRPVISNSNGDAANLIPKTVGDVDDVHQYGGWYTENIFDLRHFKEYTNRNDMLFQPCISTESIAGYTNENEEFFLEHGDVRQKKVIAMRLGKIENLRQQSRDYQGFLLKEYAEAMWRLRVAGSSFSGYIPFGQYTWFFHPFDKDKIKPKYIWNIYRMVMSPVHVQLECFNRHIEKNGYLCGKLRLWNEDVHLPEHAEFEVHVKKEGRVLEIKRFEVDYHNSHSCDIVIGELKESGKIELEVYFHKKRVAYNFLEFKVYSVSEKMESITLLLLYDPENILDVEGTRIDHLSDIKEYEPSLLCVGPYALDNQSMKAFNDVHDWMSRGGRVVVLEQNPGYFSENIFNTGISAARVCQPRWSRWAMNLVKHADRVDVCEPSHYMFKDLQQEDFFWWNEDTFLADSYLYRDEARDGDVVLSHIGNGLSEGELMPVKYEYKSSGFSITALERKIGKGIIICSSLLIGTKHKTDPVARVLLRNLLGNQN